MQWCCYIRCTPVIVRFSMRLCRAEASSALFETDSEMIAGESDVGVTEDVGKFGSPVRSTAIAHDADLPPPIVSASPVDIATAPPASAHPTAALAAPTPVIPDKAQPGATSPSCPHSMCTEDQSAHYSTAPAAAALPEPASDAPSRAVAAVRTTVPRSPLSPYAAVAVVPACQNERMEHMRQEGVAPMPMRAPATAPTPGEARPFPSRQASTGVFL